MTATIVLAGFAFAASPQPSVQNILSVDDAVRIGLDNNYSLSLAKDQSDLATLNRQSGVGPFLPTASASANHGGEFGSSVAPRTTVGVSANLALFDGFQSTFAYRRLKVQESAASLREQTAVESTVEAIVGAYYEVARQTMQGRSIREALAVSLERANLARAKQEVGSGSRLESLQAQADLNADSSALMSQDNALREARYRLNGLLARGPEVAFDVPDSIPVEAGLPLATWRTGLLDRNTTVLESRAQLKASGLAVRESRGGYLPSVSGGLGYSTAPDALNSGTSIPTTGSDGVTYNLNLTVPLFNGLRTRQSVGTARITQRQQETSLKQVESDTRRTFAEAEGRYVSGLRQIALEERTLEVARQQAEAARERYRVGASSALEFRDAQQRLLDAQSRHAAVRLTVKQSELALKRLAGVLAAPVSPEN